MPETKKFHHHLITGEIVFRHKQDETGQVNAIRVNGVLLDEARDIPARLLGKSQQILQLNFHKRMQDENIEVLDVVLVNFVYLGEFTEEQFHAAPEGTTLKPKAEGPGLAVVGGTATLEDALADAGAKEDTAAGE